MTSDTKHVLNDSQHVLFGNINMCCNVLPMNLGGRIRQRLDELGWERSRLIELVPDLTPANLSALIRRDSKRSEFDEQIAKALGVSLLWLVYGYEEKPAANLAAHEDRAEYGNPRLTADEQLLLSAYRTASEDARSAMLIWAKSVTQPAANERRAGAA